VTKSFALGRRVVQLAMVVAMMLFVDLGVASPQLPNSNGPYLGGTTRDLDRSHLPEEEPFGTRELQERQIRKLREEHQKQVFSDTATLLRLANELKAEVEKSDTPTPDALRDVEEIGKIAKRVSERIKTQ
jgi:hypothetical protein